jgi:hypothetical protein
LERGRRPRAKPNTEHTTTPPQTKKEAKGQMIGQARRPGAPEGKPKVYLLRVRQRAADLL